jgi:hypothetical protein
MELVNMARMTNQEVIKKFMGNATATSHTGNLVSENGKLINYNTVLAQWILINPEAPYSEQRYKLFINETKYSVTTSKIQTWIRYEAGAYEALNDIPRGTHDLKRYALTNA